MEVCDRMSDLLVQYGHILLPCIAILYGVEFETNEKKIYQRALKTQCELTGKALKKIFNIQAPLRTYDMNPETLPYTLKSLEEGHFLLFRVSSIDTYPNEHVLAQSSGHSLKDSAAQLQGFPGHVFCLYRKAPDEYILIQSYVLQYPPQKYLMTKEHVVQLFEKYLRFTRENPDLFTAGDETFWKDITGVKLISAEGGSLQGYRKRYPDFHKRVYEQIYFQCEEYQAPTQCNIDSVIQDLLVHWDQIKPYLIRIYGAEAESRFQSQIERILYS